MRKASRNERFIGPAAELAEMGRPVSGLLAAVEALLKFDVQEDPEAVELQSKLAAVKDGSAELPAVVTELTGIESSHPLFEDLQVTFKRALA